MNKFIADIFAGLVSAMHVIFVVGVFIFAFYVAVNPDREDYLTLEAILIAIPVTLLYVIIVGALSIFIEIHQNLAKIRELLENYKAGGASAVEQVPTRTQGRIEPRL